MPLLTFAGAPDRSNAAATNASSPTTFASNSAAANPPRHATTSQ